MIHVYPYEESLLIALGNFIVNEINTKLKEQKIFTIALSGGNTPKALYKKLASHAWSGAIPWTRVHIFWGDERYVPYDDEMNNAKMAFDTLLSKVNIPTENIHRIRTDIDINEAAKEYDAALKQFFDNDKGFDLVLLGLGEDGHTLSIFPETMKDIGCLEDIRYLQRARPWVTIITSKTPPRITLTPEIVNISSKVIFLVTGKNKAEIFQKVTAPNAEPVWPAQLIKPRSGELHWFVDNAAAGK